MGQPMYLVIDQKSFYASVECVERGLDPMTANLVVADPDRTDKTVCLAVTPAMKAKGVKGRCRVFEIPKNINYMIAPPRMRLYIDYAVRIYRIYLQYLAPCDIHVYSVDEAFLDVTRYLSYYCKTARELGQEIMSAILEQTGIRAACGIGTNLYLAKVALDITAKRAHDFIGELDEASYCRTLWDHQPLTDFWRIGPGTVRRLAKYGVNTMGRIAQMDEEFLYQLFGVDAELLIDHAWGRESATMEDIKRYRPSSNSLSSGQVLPCNYDFQGGELIVKEMMDALCLDMADRGVAAGAVGLYLSYDKRQGKPSSKGMARLPRPGNSDAELIPAVVALYRRIAEKGGQIRRVNLTVQDLVPEEAALYEQYSLFEDPEGNEKRARRRALQRAVLSVRHKYGKNAVLKGMNLLEGATMRERNGQIGGHKSGETENAAGEPGQAVHAVRGAAGAGGGAAGSGAGNGPAGGIVRRGSGGAEP